MRVRFWGTRGSISKPGPTTVRYGGNTSCVEVVAGDGTLVVLDCGTGAHALGEALLARGPRPLRGHVLISHTHWDHIQGLPFFAPLFTPESEWDIYGPRGVHQQLKDALRGQMQYTYFPVSLEDLGATIRYHDLVEGTFTVGGIRVVAQYLNHTALTLGYRLEADGVSLVYATDHEPHSARLAGGFTSLSPDVDRGDLGHAAFLAGADLVIHDAQYTAAEYGTRRGWGHSTVEYVVDLVSTAGARRCCLFHHDPGHDDRTIDRLLELARQRPSATGARLEVLAATEGQVIEVEVLTTAAEPARHSETLNAARPVPTWPDQGVLVAVDDAATASPLVDAVRADGLRLVKTGEAGEVLPLCRRERPSLLLADRRPEHVALCRAIRSDADPALRETPVCIVADAEDPVRAADEAAAGVTDWLIKPFSRHYARTRVRAWVMRAQCRWVPAPLPSNEATRLVALRRLGLLDTPEEERFGRITRLAQRLSRAPIALITLVDADRQWFKSRQGLDVTETPRDAAICAYAILSDESLVIRDTLADPRFADNPLVVGFPRIRFYAGHPLHAPDGHRVGTLCVIDHRPRELSAADLEALRDLATLAEAELRAAAQRAEADAVTADR
jgi:phosphoribosyl 1,2-cyclic phosphodiesterase/DNA-binding response OmpR family regulator